MDRSTFSGSMSRFSPNCSSRSALPHLLVKERLPCLATGIPAAATTNALVVLTLNVLILSPPVPHVSTNRSPTLGVNSPAELSHHTCKGCHLFHRFSLLPQDNEERSDLSGTCLPCHDLCHATRCLLFCQILILKEDGNTLLDHYRNPSPE